MKYVVIKNDEVINVIEWDGVTPFHYPFEHDDMVQSDELQIGMKLIDGVWKFEELIEEDV
jgi:hypothetical protein